MNRSQRTAVITRLAERLRERGSWSGETHVQKVVFVMQELLDVKFEFEFILYKHGPFSFDLRDELSSLCADNLLKYQAQSPPYGPKIGVLPDAKALQERFPKTLGSHTAKIEFVCDRLGNKGVAELERLATALWVTTREGTGDSVDQRAKKLNKLKPHVSIDEAKAAVVAMDEVIAAAKKL
jgi:hypothetical protein